MAFKLYCTQHAKATRSVHKFNQDFHKPMSNSTFGKFCESFQSRVTVSFVRVEGELLKATSDGKISFTKLIDENLTLITKKKQFILWKIPTIVGASILVLSKLFMLEFHYNLMKKQTECVLFYSDTDSFICKLKTKKFYVELEKKFEKTCGNTNTVILCP